MKYADNVDYLISSIIYLGSHTFYWARSPDMLAKELSLDEQRLKNVFDEFPGLFRKSKRANDTGHHFYSLQARYAQRDGKDTGDPEKVSRIDPIETDKIRMLLDFVMKMAEQEKVDQRILLTTRLTIATAILSAITAIVVAAGLFGAKPEKKQAYLIERVGLPPEKWSCLRYGFEPCGGLSLRRLKVSEIKYLAPFDLKPVYHMRVQAQEV